MGMIIEVAMNNMNIQKTPDNLLTEYWLANIRYRIHGDWISGKSLLVKNKYYNNFRISVTVASGSNSHILWKSETGQI